MAKPAAEWDLVTHEELLAALAKRGSGRRFREATGLSSSSLSNYRKGQPPAAPQQRRMREVLDAWATEATDQPAEATYGSSAGEAGQVVATGIHLRRLLERPPRLRAELAAMQAIADALEGLEPDERRRAMAWASSCVGGGE